MLGDLPGMATVAFAGVRVPLTQRVGAEGAGLAMVRALEQRADGLFEPAAGLSALARKLAAAAAELPGDEGPLSEDPAFARKLAELGVDLAGLEALEQRHVWQQFGGGSDLQIAIGRSLPQIAPHRVAIGRSLPLVLRLRHARVAERIGELFVEAFGYYALPYPDPLAIDNEGPIGHHYALAALRGMFAGRTPPADGDPDMGLRDRIANQLFGY
jgi:alkylation response protein AidB-like acyl-CoA dehydrogenase